ncbi:MAG: HD domain-containing protein [Clostridia bacterium]|nr:HD domain-containing protein [Clostridia bacterium]
MIQIIQEYNRKFWDYVNKFDTSNSNILRKIIHSYAVADNCFAIACKFNLNENERNFSYLLGLFHDLGRFPQWEKYQTYNDKKSVDHGDWSSEIVDKMNSEDIFITERQKEILSLAIKYHTKPYLGDDKDVIFYNEMIKNADAYSNVITTANGAQQMTVQNDGVTPEILDNFINGRPLWTFSPNTKLDRSLMLTACSYYVKFDFLRQDILTKNYIDVMFSTFSRYLNEEDKKIYHDAVETLKKKYLTLP